MKTPLLIATLLVLTVGLPLVWGAGESHVRVQRAERIQREEAERVRWLEDELMRTRRRLIQAETELRRLRSEQ